MDNCCRTQLTENIKSIGLNFGQIEYEMQIEDSVTHFLDVLNFDAIRAVYEWAKGQVVASL